MKLENQKKLVEALGCSTYSVDMVNGEISYLPPGGGGSCVVKGSLTKSGYVQHKIFKGRGKGRAVLVYWHDLVWIMINGLYPEDQRVSFKDGNLSNRVPGNLMLVKRRNRPKIGQYRRIRHDDIIDIKFYLRGKNVQASKIAKELGLSPASVARTIRKLKKGEKLKYELSNDIPNLNNKVLFGENKEL